MLKPTVIALGLTALATPALAADVHHGTCQITFPDNPGKAVTNTCMMSYKHGEGTTYVGMGNAFLLIVRSPHERGTAKLFAEGPDKRMEFMGTALADGSCWVSRRMKFCAY
jgi:hypothetical protein